MLGTVVAEDRGDPAPTSSTPAPAPEGSNAGEQPLGFAPSRRRPHRVAQNPFMALWGGGI